MSGAGSVSRAGLVCRDDLEPGRDLNLASTVLDESCCF